MARDGGGTYSVPNTFLPNTVMSASAVNQNFTDAGSEITGSLARNGSSAMVGQFKAADGAEATPGITFANDANTGLRRASADEMRWVAGGQDAFYIDSVGKAWYLGAVDIAGNLNVQGALAGASLADIAAIEALTGTGILKRTGDATWELDAAPGCFTLIKDGYGNELPTGVLGDIMVPFACEITTVTLLADQTGSIVIDLWVDAAANFPPTNDDSITSATPPTISSGVKAEDDALSSWTTSLSAGDVIRLNIDSITDIERISVIIDFERY